MGENGLKKKIVLYYIVLIVIGISIAGLCTSQLAKSIYNTEIEGNLKNSVLLITNQLDQEIMNGEEINFNEKAKEYSRILNEYVSRNGEKQNFKIRITFINFEGIVVGESETDYKLMENHLNRKEIQQAIQGEFGKDIRFSKTLKINFLYISYPLKSKNIVVRISVPLISIKHIYRTIWFYTLVGALAGIIITALIAIRISAALTSPIRQMIIATKEIAKGNYSSRISIDTEDELGKLAENFNQMAAVQERTVSELTDKSNKVNSIINSMTNGIIAIDKDYNIVLINHEVLELFGATLKKDILGSKIIEVIRNNQLNSYLRETINKNEDYVFDLVISGRGQKILRVYTSPINSANSVNKNEGAIAFIHDITNMKKLEEMRTEFVSNVTHELKTPLTSIRGFVETLRNGAIEDKDVADKFLEIIDIEAERLFILINDILQLSEIETMGKDSNITEFSLEQLVAEVISLLENAAQKKDVTIMYDIDKSILIKANRNRIKQMLINLIDNGIKYNKQYGEVKIFASKENGQLFISVKDTGIGISKEHQARIFERFYRVDKGRSRSMGGTGLGLSIVKHIVNLYDGDINIYSKANEGSEFRIKFPC